MSKKPYKILQVDTKAEPEVIEAAYRRLARKYHPDVNPSANAKVRMQEFNWAYETLRDPQKRAQYDRAAKYQRGRTKTSSTPKGTPPPKSSTYSSTSRQSSASSSRSSSSQKSSYRPSSSYTSSHTRTSTAKEKKTKNWWIIGVLVVGAFLAWTALEDGEPPPESIIPRPINTVVSKGQSTEFSDAESVILVVAAMVDDPRYDPSTSVLHKYLPYIEVELFGGRLTYIVWKDIADEDELLNLATDLILIGAIVVDGSDFLDTPLSYIEVNNPGPRDTAVLFYVAGRTDIATISNDGSRIYDVMQAEVDWGDVPPSEYQNYNNQTAVSGCPQGCTSHVSGCDIKGNISYDTGEKIFHVPGQEFYYDTKINPDYGERWFCTEQEAISSGWRKSYK